MCTNFVFFCFLISLTYALVCPNCISISFFCFQFVCLRLSCFLVFVYVCMNESIWRHCFCFVCWGCLCRCMLWDEFALLAFVIDISLTVWPFYNAFSFRLCLQLFLFVFTLQCLFCFCYKNISSGSLFIVHFYSFCWVFPIFIHHEDTLTIIVNLLFCVVFPHFFVCLLNNVVVKVLHCCCVVAV